MTEGGNGPEDYRAVPATRVLLTGASGLVGSRWLQLLLQNPAVEVIVLTRNPSLFPPHPSVKVLTGDLRAASFGLTSCQLHEIEATVDAIYHCAADIRFTISLEESRETNLNGTVNLLALAGRCRHLRHFAHVSTTYLLGRSPGVLGERPLHDAPHFLNNYGRSKWEAEAAVVSSMDRIPASIYRLSSVVCDSAEGDVSQFNYFHHLLRLIPLYDLPVLPGDAETGVDLITADWSARALAHLVQENSQAGQVYNVCAGPSGAVPLSELLPKTFARFRRPTPTLIPLAEFERYSSALCRRLQGVRSEMLRLVLTFLPHLALRQSFANADTLISLRAVGLEPPPISQFYDKVIDYCLDTGWGRRSADRASG